MKKSKTSKTGRSKSVSKNDSASDNNSAKTSASENFLIVGIGASAGGIRALKVFFENVAADSGAAYVVILHLSPDHDSQLAKVLQTVAAIPVEQVTKRVRVEPNHVYVVPPDRSLSMADGWIVVSPILTIEERRAPVDIFFRTLAESHGERNVAVVLSGTGADGSMGIKRIKERGGAAFVQNPREAEFSEMPRNSIATDLIDLILNVGEIPAQIVAYRNNPGKIEIPEEAERKFEAEIPPQEQALIDIFAQLRVRTGHDFINYKRATMLRRIERRINVRELPDITAYAAYLRENAGEAQALLKDLLISVTNFFRDKTTFLYLETEILSKLFDGKTADDWIRVWVAGCATGEEAYSLAMFLAEQAERADSAPQIQIFATDIDEASIAKAREGFYTLNDAADVSPERLKRFFTKEQDSYRIRRELRELILFAHHNVLKDPPFSRLDLVACRNMLIYLNHQAQERVMETFHFSLNAGGYLFLGNSETVDGAGNLYAPVSREHRIYQSRRAEPRVFYPVPDASTALIPFVEPNGSEPVPENASPVDARPVKRISFGALHQRLLEEYTPSVIVDEENDIVHMSESSLRFMQMSGGVPTKNLLKLIRPELRIELRTALYQAAQRQKNVEVPNVQIKVDGKEETVNIRIRPVMRQTDQARGFILILFEAVTQKHPNSESVYSSDEPVALQLEEELIRLKEQLGAAVEQYEVRAEEFKASNEELQAMNEELRSSSEELETGKEELQSVNEELGTVNQELKIKIEEISQASNNLNNLINSTDIGTIFLDRVFRVDLFTPAAAEIFNLIPADIGRPLADIAHRLEKTDLLDDARLVLEKLQTVEREVRTIDNRIFALRVLPYQTKEDKIGGVVLTFYDVTARKTAEKAVRESEEMFRAFVTTSTEAVYWMNPDWTEMRRLHGKEFIADTSEPNRDWLETYIPPDDRERVLETIGEAVRTKSIFELEHPVLRVDGSLGWTFSRAIPLLDPAGEIVQWFGTASDITARRQTQKDWRASEEKYRSLFNSIDEAFALCEIVTNKKGVAVDFRLLELNPAFEKMTGTTTAHALGKTARQLIPTLEDQWIETYARVALGGEIVRFENQVRELNRRFDVHASPLGESGGGKFAIVFKDITERESADAKMRESDLQMRLVVEAAEMGTWDWNLQTGALFWNQQHYILFGLEPGDGWVTYEDFERGVHPDYRATVREQLTQALELNTVFQTEFPCVHPDGRTRWMSGYGRAIEHDAAGKATRMTGVMFDATERKQAEELLRVSEERLRLLVESAADYAIFTTTPDNQIDSWSAGAEKVFGWTESEALGKSGAIIFTPEDRAKGAPEQEIQIALQEGRAPDERFHLRKSGALFYASGVMTLLKDVAGRVQGFVKIARDMTEQIEAERAVRDKEMLQKLVAAQEGERKRIARDLHDELGQQLTALRLKLDAARKICGDAELCGEIDEMELIAKNIDHGVDFLAWELRPAALDDLGLVAVLDNYVKQWSNHSGVTAELRAVNLKRARFPSEIETNLYRIVQEALNNTHKHARAKSVEVVLEKRDGLIALLIEDDGAGFNLKNKKNSLKGIGLTGMKERAALIGGTLEIESAPRKGTTVFVRIPTSTLKRRSTDAE